MMLIIFHGWYFLMVNGGDDVDNLPWLIFSVYWHWRVYFPFFSIAWMMVVMGQAAIYGPFPLHLEASPCQEPVGVPGPPGGSSQWLVCVQKNALKTSGHPQQQMFYLDKPWFVHVCSREHRPCFTSMPVHPRSASGCRTEPGTLCQLHDCKLPPRAALWFSDVFCCFETIP